MIDTKTLLFKDLLRKKINEILNRNPHEQEFESGSEDFKHCLLSNIDHLIFNEELFGIEKVNMTEVSYILDGVLDFVNSFGEKDLIDEGHTEKVSKELIDYGFRLDYKEKIDENLMDEDVVYYHRIICTNFFNKTFKIDVLYFNYMYGQPYDNFYLYKIEEDDFYSNSLTDLVKFMLNKKE